MVEVVGRAMKLVGAGFVGEVCCSAWIAPKLGCARGDKGEVFNGIDGEDHARYRRDSALVDCGNVPPKIVVVRAFDLPIYRVGPGSVHTGIECTAASGQSS